MNLPVWFDGQNINEALFCEEFLQERKIVFANRPQPFACFLQSGCTGAKVVDVFLDGLLYPEDIPTENGSPASDQRMQEN